MAVGEAAPTNLERVPTRFIGRAADLTALARLFENERVVTILGPPGTGKTRLAREFATRAIEGPNPFAEIWFCDLTEVADPEGLVAVVSAALGVTLSSNTPKDAIAAIGRILAERGTVLLVLDNVEQLVASARDALVAWRDAAPHAKFLVASRQRLDLAGEVLFDVGPLSLPAVDGTGFESSEAVELFVDRARTVRRGFEVSAADRTAVAELVRHLDGLPLAIELAAARLRLLSPAQILTELPRRFQLLRADRKDLDRRRATLWGAIEWSWELLKPWEQAALAQCSVFRGGFALEAAEAVLDLSEHPDAPWPLDALQSLRDKSLLNLYEVDGPHAETRFALYVSIRDFAGEKLAATPHEARTLERHARYYLAAGKKRVIALDSGASGEALRWLSTEMENLLAVLRRAHEDTAATGRFRFGPGGIGAALPPERAERVLAAALVVSAALAVQGPFGRSLSILDGALAAVSRDAVPATLYAKALQSRAAVKRRLGRTAECIADCEAARAVAETLPDGQILAEVLSSLAWIRLMQGRPLEARSTYEEALAIHRRNGDRRLEGRCLASLGDTYYWSEGAGEKFTAALAIHREVGDPRFEAFTLCKLAAVETQQRDYLAARDHFKDALRIGQELGDRRSEAVTLGCMAILEHDEDRPAESEALFERALGIHREIHNRWFEGFFVGYHGNLLFDRGAYDEARARYEEALRIHREVGWSPYEGVILGCIGALQAVRGDAAGAQSALDAAERRLRGIGSAEHLLAVRLHRGHLDAPRDPVGTRRRMSESVEAAQRSIDVRFALRLLAKSLGEPIGTDIPASPAGAKSPADAVFVCESGRWFQLATGDRVSLQRRRALHLVLKALADAHRAGPGTALSVEALLEKGWPGERVHPEAGADRVYMALSTLRKLGLRDVLLSRDDGYLIDPQARVVRIAE